jgi:hypothetical protein
MPIDFDDMVLSYAEAKAKFICDPQKGGGACLSAELSKIIEKAPKSPPDMTSAQTFAVSQIVRLGVRDSYAKGDKGLLDSCQEDLESIVPAALKLGLSHLVGDLYGIGKRIAEAHLPTS